MEIFTTQNLNKIKIFSQLEPSVSIGRGKILIVDDSFIVRCALDEMLNELGHLADFAEDGKTALTLYGPRYSLILMDVDLPDFNGMEITQIIRKIEKKYHLSTTPIIGITSHADELEYQKKCLESGMNACYGKPKMEQLKEWIEEYLSSDSKN